MGAVVYTDQVQTSLFVGAHGSTFGGNPLACAAGVAALSVYQEGLIEQAERAGRRLWETLEGAIGGRRIVREMRGPGADCRHRPAHEGDAFSESADGRAQCAGLAGRLNRAATAAAADHQ